MVRMAILATAHNKWQDPKILELERTRILMRRRDGKLRPLFLRGQRPNPIASIVGPPGTDTNSSLVTFSLHPPPCAAFYRRSRSSNSVLSHGRNTHILQHFH